MLCARWFLFPGNPARLVTGPVFLLVLCFAVLLNASGLQAIPIRVYVDADASGNDDGTTWTDAYIHLQDALDAVNADLMHEYDLWVAEGIYYPDEGAGRTDDDRNECFRLEHDGIRLYGGFAGGETSRTQRDWEVNRTVLSGDIDQNDNNADGNHVAENWSDVAGSNAYHVLWLDGVTNEAITADTVIDGFFVTAGQANAAAVHNSGGGIYCQGSGAGHECSPELRNLTLSGNQGFCGGGMVNDANNDGESSPTLTHVVFRGNLADSQGGGIYNFAANNHGSVSNPVLTNVKFIENDAQQSGGGMYSIGHQGTSSPVLTNVLFFGNQADLDGNNDGYGGGIGNFGSQGTSSPVLTNVTFSGNGASLGGGMYNFRYGLGACSPDLTNVILWGNTATGSGPQVYNDSANPGFSYSDIQGSGGSGSWDPAVGADNGHNIDADPLYVDAAGGDARLKPASPAVDAGDTSALPADAHDLDGDGDRVEPIPWDVGGRSRVQSSAVDMGAYETPASVAPVISLPLLDD